MSSPFTCSSAWRRSRISRAAWIVRSLLIGVIAWVGGADADTRIERLVMPGPLIASHARYEDRCEDCHQLLSKRAQTMRCRNCHDEIDDDIRKVRGFHGRIDGIADMECRRCHTDHIGREADIVMLDAGTFDHDATDFALKGGHRNVECSGCHAEDRKRRDAPHDCFSCHRDDDAHREKLGHECGDCHHEEDWQAAREKFDHAKTRFPLDGKHRDAACASCHPSARYRDIARECHACHALSDVHAGRYGRKCESCHSELDWKKSKFDHARDTKFALRGQHAKVTCETCHTGRLDEKVPTDCHGCHAGDDDHAGRNGRDCADCHQAEGWEKVRFDHAADTQFPLRGRHNGLDCNACHRVGVAPRETPRDCYGCHQTDDRHQGKLGRKCESCHREESWQVLHFDHDKDTDYPLVGRHAKVACEQCHSGSNYHDELGTACIDCHREDDPHAKQQGEACADCHTLNGWQEVRFEHDLTAFPLIGIHATTPCEACHVSAAYQDAGEKCVDCHRKDDTHQGHLGPDCSACHNPNDWKLWEFDHDTRTEYRLEGAHRGLSCTACHSRPVDGEIDLATDCYSCHIGDDVHDAVFGKDCAECHSMKSFSGAQVRH